MKIKTSELTDADLDWAVSQIEGKYKYYSIDWYAAGPIIEREAVELSKDLGRWTATIRVDDEEPWELYGPTPLIAAMRCYVASKLGNEVEIPEALTVSKS